MNQSCTSRLFADRGPAADGRRGRRSWVASRVARGRAVGYGLRASPKQRVAGRAMGRASTLAAVSCVALGLAGCGGGTSFGSMPFAIVMPSGEVLKGSASTQVYKGTF